MVIDFYAQIAHNKKMTYLLFLMFFLLIGFLSYIISFIIDLSIGGGFYFIFSIFGILSILFALFAYYNSDSIVTKVSGAVEADPEIYPKLHNIVEGLCLASGLPKPRIFVIDDSAINAFASGRDPEHGVICLTTGCFSRLNRDQIEGVVAHELAHIKNYDIRTMTMATVLVGIAVLLSDLLIRMFFYGGLRNSSSKDNAGLMIALVVVSIVLAILTPIIAKMITFAISRKREFGADASAVEMTRNPEGLASALEVISKDTEKLEVANKATAHLYIANPLKGQKLWMKSMFSTHPPINMRINALRGIKN